MQSLLRKGDDQGSLFPISPRINKINLLFQAKITHLIFKHYNYQINHLSLLKQDHEP